MKLKIKVDGISYYLCGNCGVYKKDKFNGKIKNQKYCVPCLSLGGTRLEIKNVVNRQK